LRIILAMLEDLIMLELLKNKIKVEDLSYAWSKVKNNFR
jgi:hypothetical protein